MALIGTWHEGFVLYNCLNCFICTNSQWKDYESKSELQPFWNFNSVENITFVLCFFFEGVNVNRGEMK